MNPEGLKQIIEALKSVLPQAERIEGYWPFKRRSVDMLNANVECGTPMCFAGWYAISQQDRLCSKEDTFMESVREICTILGFRRQHLLDIWLYDNIDIWGETANRDIFASDGAFIEPGDNYKEITKLSQIIKHLERVHERLIAARSNELIIKAPLVEVTGI